MDLEETERFADRITQRRDLMAQILRTTLLQEQAVSEGLVEALVARLNEKEALVNELRKIQLALKPSAEVHPETRQWSSEHARVRCRQELIETEKLQVAIMEIDTRCERAMIERKDELFASLGKTAGAATVSRAYSANRVQQNPAQRGGGSFDASSS